MEKSLEQMTPLDTVIHAIGQMEQISPSQVWLEVNKIIKHLVSSRFSIEMIYLFTFIFFSGRRGLHPTVAENLDS